MNARHLMNRSVKFCSVNDTLHDAARIMWEADVGALPVVDEARLVVAMITDRDICMAAYTQGRALAELPVSSAMSKRIVSCYATTTLAELVALMSDAQIRRIPVVDEAGLLVGIVTLADVARHAQSSLLSKSLETPRVARTVAAVSERRPSATGRAA